MAPDNDRELGVALQALARNRCNEEAWKVLHRQLRPFLYAVCYRAVGGLQGLADDACQETLLRLLRSCPFENLTNPDEFRAYAGQVATHAAIDVRAKARRHSPGEDQPEPPSQDPLPDEQITALETKARVLSVLGALDQAILRRVLAGEGAQEIAASVGLHPNAVHQRLFRIRGRLRKLLQDKD